MSVTSDDSNSPPGTTIQLQYYTAAGVVGTIITTTDPKRGKSLQDYFKNVAH